MAVIPKDDDMVTLAAVIITHNEESNIEGCLDSVTWVDEIVVVDAGSTDRTRSIAGKYTPKVFENTWTGYSAQKNFAHSKVESDWILSIDADERVSEQLRAEILQWRNGHSTEARVVAYTIPRKNWMFGKFINYGSWRHERPVRLYQKSKEVQWKGVVHEHLSIDGRIGAMSNPLLHYSHRRVGHFVAKLNRYTEIEATEMYQQGRRVKLLATAFGAVRAFLGQYVRLQGFRDGGHGFILAVLMALYYFTVRAKLWSLWYIREHQE